MTELPFNISVSSEQLDALKQRLALTRFPDELDDAGWAYGAPLTDIKRLVARWQDGYDWRKHEALLNAELPQFTRDIVVDGFGTLNVHYVHKRSALETAIPLLFVHGYYTPLLTVVQPDRPSFHVCNKLMISLGYDEYVTQGGDWGSMITRKIATVYGGQAQQSMAHQLPSVCVNLSSLNLAQQTTEKLACSAPKRFRNTGLGYLRLQSTKPQTIGYSVSGFAGWAPRVDLRETCCMDRQYPWDDDEILTWISIYWFSRAGPAATQRIYYEVASENAIIPSVHGVAPTIPSGPFLSFLESCWVRRTGNVVFEGEHPMGGHFAAHETPELLVADLRKMFGRGGPAYGVVPGRVGY
ncbi:Alpha/Beta hydrolase protein [Mycena olivaceomarginata]|nr:Alpha/Beta hydrolase protein [Mycena olivaceomarginata]